MKYLENAEGKFVFFKVKSQLLCDLLKDFYPFFIDGDVVTSDWMVKADAFCGENEHHFHYLTNLYSIKTCDHFCDFFINFLNLHKECGISTYEHWREALRYYSFDEGENFSPDPLYEEQLEPFEIEKLIQIITERKDEINSSIESFCIFDYVLSGDYNSELSFVVVDADIQCYEEWDEDDINEFFGVDSLADDLFMDEYALSAFSEELCTELYPC